MVVGNIPVLEQWMPLESTQVKNGQWWRLITAHFTHFGMAHAAINFAVLVPLVIWARKLDVFYSAALLLLVSTLFLSLALLFLGFDWYAGLSGVLHGLVIYLLLQSPNRVKFIGLALFAAKLIWQYQSGYPVAASSQIPVLQEAHWLGAAIGAIYYLMIHFANSLKRVQLTI